MSGCRKNVKNAPFYHLFHTNPSENLVFPPFHNFYAAKQKIQERILNLPRKVYNASLCNSLLFINIIKCVEN